LPRREYFYNRGGKGGCTLFALLRKGDCTLCHAGKGDSPRFQEAGNGCSPLFLAPLNTYEWLPNAVVRGGSPVCLPCGDSQQQPRFDLEMPGQFLDVGLAEAPAAGQKCGPQGAVAQEAAKVRSGHPVFGHKEL
jgi:hypothetical protein